MYSAVIWAMRPYYRKTPAMRAKMSRISRHLYRAFSRAIDTISDASVLGMGHSVLVQEN